jgi:hypothetical protein
MYKRQVMFIVETIKDMYDLEICFSVGKQERTRCRLSAHNIRLFFRVKAMGSLGVVRTRDTRPFLPDGLHGRSHPVRDENFIFPPKASSPARSSVSAPFHNFRNPHLLGIFLLVFFLFCFDIRETPRQRCAITHPVLARRRNFPTQNGEKVTSAATVSKRSRSCKNGYRHVARTSVAPTPRVVSKIRGETGISYVWDGLRKHSATGAQGLRFDLLRDRRGGLVERVTREGSLPRSGRVHTTRRLMPKRNGLLRTAASPSLAVSIFVLAP